MKITFLNTNRQEMTFDNGTVTVGREEDNTIQLQSDGISRHHGKIYSDANGDWFVEDLGSTNGIRLNGKKITAAVKRAEDDVMDFHQDKLKISGIAALDTIAFTPVST
ncbi:MAG: FHA domain-containing protein, partial [Lentisphaeria bacterium]|nr:FHA domain-containing protein [Lentisphaeria bacterium]